MNVSNEIIAEYVSCSSHNATAHLAANTTSTDTDDVMSVANHSIYHRGDVISGVGTLPLLRPPATDVDARLISGLWPSWLESVDSYRSCQLSYAVYAWRLLLALKTIRVATDVERSTPNHDVSAATRYDPMLLDSVNRSLRRFHPYLL